MTYRMKNANFDKLSLKGRIKKLLMVIEWFEFLAESPADYPNSAAH